MIRKIFTLSAIAVMLLTSIYAIYAKGDVAEKAKKVYSEVYSSSVKIPQLLSFYNNKQSHFNNNQHRFIPYTKEKKENTKISHESKKFPIKKVLATKTISAISTSVKTKPEEIHKVKKLDTVQDPFSEDSAPIQLAIVVNYNGSAQEASEEQAAADNNVTSKEDNASEEKTSNVSETDPANNIDPGDDTGSGDDIDPGDDTGSGDDIDIGDDTGSGDDIDPGDDTGSGDDIDPIDDTGSGDDTDPGGDDPPPSPVYDDNIEIIQPYSDKIVLARTDLGPNVSYEWKINGDLAEEGTTSTTFLEHFNGSISEYNGGKIPDIISDINFEDGKFGKGMTGQLEYDADQNLSYQEGTIEMWIKLKQPLSSPVFAGTDGYFLHYRNPTTHSSMLFRVNQSAGILQFILYNGVSWSEGSSQLSTSYEDIPINDNIYIAFNYSQERGKANLYIDGFKIDSRDYDFEMTDTDTFKIGNPNIVIDEFRISNKYLSDAEIRENYVRGIPFSDNDVYFSGDKETDDVISFTALSPDGSEREAEPKSVNSPKINMISPSGYVVANSDSLTATFETPTPMTCSYSNKAKLHSKLQLTADTNNGLVHTITHNVTSTIDSINLYIKCSDGESEPDDYAFYRRYRMLPNIDDANFPKIANLWWGNSVSEDDVEILAKYDVIGISKSNIVKPKILKAIREINPNIVILFYKTMVGIQDFNFWYFSDFKDTLKDEWKVPKEGGGYIDNLSFPNNKIYNLYTPNPFAEKMADHLADMMARGIFDGVWYDVAGRSMWLFRDYSLHTFPYKLDFDYDGIYEDLNTSEGMAKAKQIWGNGLEKIMDCTRQALGWDTIIVGNGAEYDHAPFYNGIVWEEFFDYNTADGFLRSGTGNHSFEHWDENVTGLNFNWNMFVNNNYSDYKRMRYGLAGTTIGGAILNLSPKDNCRSDFWYDYYSIDLQTARPTGDTSGKGFLGHPTGDRYEVNGDHSKIWRRDFDNGIVLFNDNSTSKTVYLGKTYRNIIGSAASPSGIQPTASSVTLQAYDGLFMLKPLCSDNPNYDDDCIE